jgi:hypothetical protein
MMLEEMGCCYREWARCVSRGWTIAFQSIGRQWHALAWVLVLVLLLLLADCVGDRTGVTLFALVLEQQ